MHLGQIRTVLFFPRVKIINADLHYNTQPTEHETAVPIVSATYTCVYHIYVIWSDYNGFLVEEQSLIRIEEIFANTLMLKLIREQRLRV
jgi:hypothetical protein